MVAKRTPSQASTTCGLTSLLLSPHTAELVVGFDPDNYTIRESNGSVSVVVRVLEGHLDRSAEVSVSLTSGSALGKSRLNSLHALNSSSNCREFGL